MQIQGQINCAAVVMSSAQPGAVGIVQLHGSDAARVLQELTGKEDWAHGRLRLVDLGGVDHGLAVVMEPEVAQLMPHGGPRVMGQLIERLGRMGVRIEREADARAMYPEAGSAIEADMLAAIARAGSAGAIDLLAAQPDAWRSWLERWADAEPAALSAELERVAARTRVLGRLIEPAWVVVAGAANVGKSTLSNRMLGRSASVVADLPGTTRDWVGGLAELSVRVRGGVELGVAVRWMDTPGLRGAGERVDAVEQAAIGLARQAMERAGVLIAMRDPEQEWPAAEQLSRVPDVWVVNKVDEAGEAGDGAGMDPGRPLELSALHGHGVEALERRIGAVLGLADAAVDGPWAFSARLSALVEPADRHSAAAGVAGLVEYVGG